MIRPGRGVADRQTYPRLAYDNPLPAYAPPRTPLSRDTDAARGIALGMALSVPIWLGLAGLAWWAWLATGCRS